MCERVNRQLPWEPKFVCESWFVAIFIYTSSNYTLLRAVRSRLPMRGYCDVHIRHFVISNSKSLIYGRALKVQDRKMYFTPCHFVLHFQVLRFLFIIFGRPYSGSAFSVAPYTAQSDRSKALQFHLLQCMQSEVLILLLGNCFVLGLYCKLTNVLTTRNNAVQNCI